MLTEQIEQALEERAGNQDDSSDVDSASATTILEEN